MVETYFKGTDSNGQYELWQTDGTAAGTTEVTRDLGLRNQTGGLTPSSIFVYGSEVLFNGYDSGGSHTLWTYFPATGTVNELAVSGQATPQQVTGGFNPGGLILYHNLVYFAADSNTSAPYDLWSTDGTAVGTQMIGPIVGTNTYGVDPDHFVVFQDHLMFTGVKPGNGGYGVAVEFTSDGTAAGTSLYSNTPIGDPLVLGTNLLYVTSEATAPYNVELYSTSHGELTGGQGGTQSLQPDGLDPANLTLLGAAVLFNGNDAANHHELYRSDGTAPGTQELNGIAGENANGLDPSAGAAIGGRMLFAGNDTTMVYGYAYRGLWTTDGTVAGTHEITVAGASQSGLGPLDLTPISTTQAIFNGLNAANGRGLWITDGTSAGTYEITNIAGAAAGGINPGNFTASPIVACFAAGTRIATARGAVAVEAMQPGDLVHSAFGGMVPVRWIGHRSIDCRRHADPAAVWPVRVRSGAFGPGLPARDLRLSPDHAVHVDGVLIPIRCLVDGDAVVQVAVDTVTYFHVEMPQHDVLFADGLPCESYLDCGNRHAFDGGGAALVLHPNFACEVWQAEACAPQVTHGPILEAVRHRLTAIAAADLPDSDQQLRRA